MKDFLKIWSPAVWLRQHLEYFFWKRGNKNKAAAHLYKQGTLKWYASKYKLDTLVETGTYLGEMVWAMRKNFSKIYSIEIAPLYFKKATLRFASYKHIHILEGDSGELLGKLMPDLGSGVLFWLDGHYSGGSTGRGEVDTPVVKEVKSVLQNMSGRYVILIDDARLFTGHDGYPTFEDLTAMVKNLKSDMVVEKESDIIRIFSKV